MFHYLNIFNYAQYLIFTFELKGWYVTSRVPPNYFLAFKWQGMLENSQNLAHMSERVWVFCVIWSWGLIAPPTKFKWSSPRVTFHLAVWNMGSRCIICGLQKTSWSHTKEVTNWNWICNFRESFANDALLTSTYSNLNINWIDFKFGQCNLKTFVMLHFKAFEISSKAVAAAMQWTSMFQN